MNGGATYGHWGRPVVAFPTERGDAAYFNNPMDYVAHLGGDHLKWLRAQVSLLLVCVQGQWEDTTGPLESTRRFAALLADEGDPLRVGRVGTRRCARLPWWHAPLAHHLPRFC